MPINWSTWDFHGNSLKPNWLDIPIDGFSFFSSCNMLKNRAVNCMKNRWKKCAYHHYHHHRRYYCCGIEYEYPKLDQYSMLNHHSTVQKLTFSIPSIFCYRLSNNGPTSLWKVIFIRSTCDLASQEHILFKLTICLNESYSVLFFHTNKEVVHLSFQLEHELRIESFSLLHNDGYQCCIFLFTDFLLFTNFSLFMNYEWSKHGFRQWITTDTNQNELDNGDNAILICISRHWLADAYRYIYY